MVTQEIKELRDPQWILDRRNSGRLFWRRDSISEKKRVKFRCDVEVLEFQKPESERQAEADWSSEDEDEDPRYRWRHRWRDEDMQPPSGFWGGVCLLVIAAVVSYQWLSV